MNQRIRTFLVSFAIVLTFGASLASAQVEKTATANEAETGTIVAIDAKAGTFTLKGADEAPKMFVADPKVTVMSSKKGSTGDQAKETIDLSKLKVGEHVVLNADVRGGKNVVTYIEVVDAP